MIASAESFRQLLLLRNGKGANDQILGDSERPLKNRGKRAAQCMGISLMRRNIVPDLVISSPGVRTKTTAEKTCKVMGLDSRAILDDARLYTEETVQLLEVLASCSSRKQKIMLVGRKISLERLLNHLTGTVDIADKPGLAPASLAQLKMPKDWTTLKPGCAQLLSLTHANELPKKFPYPNFDSAELRDRPAYYYTQSSVIPYRLDSGRLEILITGSSKMKHWVVPKGIVEPGLSPQSSAAKEAFEEAGVEGKVGNEQIGEYYYEKWGSRCAVQVYPMLVTRVIPEHDWKERHRHRQWVSPEQATNLLKQTELAAMVKAIARKQPVS